MAALPDLLGESAGIVALRAAVARLLEHSADGRRLAPVLIQGETGTGKTVLARAIHEASPRRRGPFVNIHPGAIADTMVERELFGNERGAYTDAREARPGYFQMANGGTLFLDEIGTMSPAFQGKLLKAIEERTVRRMGGGREEPVDIWVISASNTDLAEEVRAGRFRADLYYRMAGVTLKIPPLRERGDDIVMLAEHFLGCACRLHEIPPRRLDGEARRVLLAHDWRGNVRDLARVMECAAVFSDGPVVTDQLVRSHLDNVSVAPREHAAPPRAPWKDERDALARERLQEALEECGGNLTRAAARVGMKRNTFRYQLERHGLREPARPARRSAGTPPPGPAELAPPPSEPRRVGFLRLAASPAGPETARALEAAEEKVHVFGGRVEEPGATGFMAVFGLGPIEDAPRRAAHAAMAIQKAAERERGDGAAVSVRLGLDVRRVPVRLEGATVTLDANARREAWAALETLLARARPETTVVSAGAAPFLERRFELARLDDGDALPPAFCLGAQVSAGRPGRAAPSGFVGRARDLDALHEQLTATLGGRGRAVGIVGDAGIGKSRLVAEFCRTLPRGRVRWVEGFAVSYASAIPYAPMLPIVRELCGIRESDPATAAQASVRQRLETLGLDAAELAPYLLHLLGLRESRDTLTTLAPEAIRMRTVQAVRQLLRGTSREQPLVVVVEDLHWADQPSHDVLAALVNDLPEITLMLVTTYRPGFRPAWMDRAFAAELALAALSPEDSVTLIRSALAQGIADAVTRTILDKAEGNPFFIEEICATVQAHGPGTIATVPDTIEDVLVARIEGLSPDLRERLQTAAVVGRRFAPRVLGALGSAAERVDADLRALTALEFLSPAREGEETVYVFKHALTQEVAYASLSRARREALHVAVGQALERLHAGRLDEAYDRLAYHFARTEEAAKAVEYLDRFARVSARAGANETAMQAWKEALQHVERLPPDGRVRRRLEILLALPEALLPLGRVGEATALLLQERERLEQLREPTLAARYYYLLARAYMMRNHALVVEHAGRSIAEAGRCGDDATKGAAYGVLAVGCALSGQPRRGLECGRTAVALLEKTHDLWSLSYSYWALGLCSSEIGAFGEALAAEQRALEIAEALGSQPLESSALWVMGIIDAVMGEWDRGIARCRQAVEKAGDILYRAINGGFLGLAYVEAGQPAAAIGVLEKSLPLMHQFGLNAHAAWFTVFLAEACRLEGRLERAEALAETARRVALETHFGVAAGWAQHSLARIAAARGDVTTARRWFDEALSTFGATESRYETARIQLDLALLSADRGDREVACRHLGAAWALFEELGVPHYQARVAALAAEWGVGRAEAV